LTDDAKNALARAAKFKHNTRPLKQGSSLEPLRWCFKDVMVVLPVLSQR